MIYKNLNMQNKTQIIIFIGVSKLIRYILQLTSFRPRVRLIVYREKSLYPSLSSNLLLYRNSSQSFQLLSRESVTHKQSLQKRNTQTDLRIYNIMYR